MWAGPGVVVGVLAGGGCGPGPRGVGRVWCYRGGVGGVWGGFLSAGVPDEYNDGAALESEMR